MPFPHRPVSAAAAAALLPAAVASAQLNAEFVAGGFSQPLFAATTPNDSSTLYVLEKSGRIKTVDAATGGVTGTFLDLSSRVSTTSEQGLLGLAFAPDYASSGEFYVNYTDNSGTSTIARHRRSASNPLVADPNGRTILQTSQPQDNHNGGWIGFSPVDGQNLYYSVGDGGGGNDNGPGHTPGIGNAQDGSKRLGKLLRLDVGGSDFNRTFSVPGDNPFVGGGDGIDDLVYAEGLRNAFRSSFDRATGDLYLGDVGQNRREEVSLLPAGESGYNFGWRLREGYIATPTGGPVGGPRPERNADPIFDYAHSNQSAGEGTPGTGLRPVLGRSVTGGYVYRGEDLGPNFQGKYIFGDFVTGRIFALDVGPVQGFDDLSDFSNLENLDLDFDDITAELFPDGSPGNISSFGEDADGELYVVSLNGGVYRIDFDKLAGDATFDGSVTIEDFAVLRSNFGLTGDARFQDGDFNGDDAVTIADFAILRANFGTTVSAAQLAEADAWAAAVVPEPAAAALLATAAGLLLRRR